MKILKVPGKVRKQITLFCQALFYGPILTAQQKMASFHSAALHIDPYLPERCDEVEWRAQFRQFCLALEKLKAIGCISFYRKWTLQGVWSSDRHSHPGHAQHFCGKCRRIMDKGCHPSLTPQFFWTSFKRGGRSFPCSKILEQILYDFKGILAT